MKLHSKRFAMPSFFRPVIAATASVSLLCSLVLSSNNVWAIDPFVVQDIRIEGIQRTEAGTVFNYLPIRVGDIFTDEKSVTAIKSLYATGFFKDVRIEVEGNVLVVVIEERPTISTVEFSGIKTFEKDVLIKALKEIGVAESRIFDKASIDRAEQELKRQYLSRGLYGAQITTTVTPIERNRVTINFSVDEGDVSKIRKINIVGNKVFSDKELLSVLSLSTPGFFTWYTKADQYSKQKLSGDIEALKSYYLNRGYIEMQVESTQVSITPDKKDIFITINISEGEKYTVSGIKFEGEMLGRDAELKSLVQLKTGDVYSGEKLADSTKKISERMGDFGYAFANVNAHPEMNKEKKEVAFTVLVDPGKRVYVRRINFSGNTGTRDEVIRREFRQFESSWYDGNKIRASRDRVDRLAYFKEVNIETPEVPGTSDQVDVNVSVTEKPTGNFMVGAGFSQSDKFTVSSSIQQTNFAGSGNTVGLDVNTSKLNRTVALSHVNPYFTEDGVSRSVEVFLRTTRPSLVSTGDYTVQTSGSNIRFGVPYSELDTIFFGVGLEHTKVETDSTSPQRYLTYAQDFGDGVTATTNSYPLTAAWQRDSRDSALVPSVGRYQRANLELSLVGDLQYYRTIYEHQYFKPISRTMTLALKGEFDYGRGLGSKPYPIFKNFTAGGIGSVRGFDSASLGALDKNGDPLGGSSRLIANAELQFPFPGSSNDRTLRWFTFLDAGNVFQEGQKMNISELRYATGLGLSWVSPIGPLKLSYGKPLNAKPEDKVRSFQFQMGTGF